jgi:hypothetical protein
MFWQFWEEKKQRTSGVKLEKNQNFNLGCTT